LYALAYLVKKVEHWLAPALHNLTAAFKI